MMAQTLIRTHPIPLTGGGKKGGGKSSGGGGGTSTTGGTTTQGRFKIPGSSRGATPFAPGGGKVGTIGKGVTFAGRQIGGGSRAQVYETSRYGSGYTYGGAGSFVRGRGFPLDSGLFSGGECL